VSRYSEERKQQILSKLLPPSNMSVAEVAKAEGISEQTLYNWQNKAKQQGRPVPGNKPTSEQWSAEAKLVHISEHSDHPFRDYTIADFAIIRSPIPRFSGHF